MKGRKVETYNETYYIPTVEIRIFKLHSPFN